MQLQVCLVGAGRIGRIHAQNLASHRDATLRYVVDIDETAAQSLALECSATTSDLDCALSDPDIAGVVIASATDTHAELIERATDQGKSVFCEKPLDLSAARAAQCVDHVKTKDALVMMGFNRRFDPDFAALKSTIESGRIGDTEVIHIVSRDPAPPPYDYIRDSGGLFRDMSIHDLDMARWLLEEEPATVSATGSCVVDSRIGQLGDLDTAIIVLKTDTGKICMISNSRRAVYGYDQRIEVLGSTGMAHVTNRVKSMVRVSSPDAERSSNPENFFLERYDRAYRAEIDHFVRILKTGAAPGTTIIDGLRALELADAAERAYRAGSQQSVEYSN